MRKKLLSLLTVLCLVLGMLPTTALAAATEAYEKNEVALIITTDTEITEDVEGLVLVDAPCKVTVTDAKLSVGIVVSPDAAGAEVVLNGTTESAEVVVLASASVKVEETANAGAVTVDAAEATVEIAGTAAEVTVTENAEKAAVTVAETAKVETVTVAAPAAAVAVAGEVKTVAVAETAAAASVTVAETATVAALEVAAPDVKAEVAGTVETVTVAETATGAELVVAETATITEVTDATGELTVSGDGAANVTVKDATASDEEEKKDEEEEKKDDAKEETPNFDPAVPMTPSYNGPRIVWAHQVGTENGEISQESVHGNVDYTATADKRATVTLSAQDVPKHTSTSGAGGGQPAYWIGFAIEQENGYDYKAYVIQKNNDGSMPESPTWTAMSLPDYDYMNGLFSSFYFSVDYTPTATQGVEDGEPVPQTETPASVKADKETEYIVVVTKVPADSAAPTADGDDTVIIETPDDLPDVTKGDGAVEGEELVYIYDVVIDATVIPAAAPEA